MKALILVGGKGTRLRPLTCSIPKVVVPILNRPLLEYTLRKLETYGIREVVLATGYLREVVQQIIGDGKQFGVRTFYTQEQQPLGTSGAAKNAEAYFDEPFIIFNGDNLTGIDLKAMIDAHHNAKPKVTIALTPVDNPTLYGVVETDKDSLVKSFIEKPAWDKVTSNLINAGMYIIEPEVLRLVPSGVFSMFEQDVFPVLLQRGERVLGFRSEAYWIDIGAPDKYLKANFDLLDLRGNKIFQEGTSEIHAEAHLEPPVLIGEGCSIGAGAHVIGPVILGKGCRIMDGVTLKNSVLWDGIEVWRDTAITECVLASGTTIEEGCRLDDCVIGHHSVVGRGVIETGARLPPQTYLAPNGAKTPAPLPSICPS